MENVKRKKQVKHPPCPTCGAELFFVRQVGDYEPSGVVNNAYQCPNADCKVVEIHLLISTRKRANDQLELILAPAFSRN